MARIAGRNGSLYMNLTSAGTPEPVAYLNHWTVNYSVNTIDVTSFGDTTKVYVAGLPDFQGSYGGFYDNGTVQMYTAATDGIARKFYLYPDRTLSTQYWLGTATFDFSVDGTVDGAVTLSGNFSAAGPTTKVG